MTKRLWAVGCLAATVVMSVVCVVADRANASSVDASLSAQCAMLGQTDFSIIQDAPTQVTSTKLVPVTWGAPAYCRVAGYVAPQVGFEMRLPSSNWNGKFLALGNGGWGGGFDGDECKSYVNRGYTCIVSDTGHKGRGDDGLWALNNLSAQVDFGYRATHVTTLAGKAIVERYYSRAPSQSYFTGCSTGGYEGLVEAQRFPWDFDGIIAGSPDMDEADLVMRELWGTRNFLDKSGQPILGAGDIQLLHRAVLAQCDADDGVKDGIIGNPLRCQFNPSPLVCKAGKKSGCLAPSQVEAIKRIYAGPTTSDGKPTSTRGVLPGSELGWNGDGSFLGLHIGPMNGEPLLNYMIYGASPGRKTGDFDFDRDYKRLGLAALYTDTNPDLRKFKAAGGKLIVYQGANDVGEVPGAIVDYYETTERTMGGRVPTQDFFRFFMVPGMGHCSGGVGAYAIDYLSYLEAWVEKHQAPDVMIGAHVSDNYLASLPSVVDAPAMTTAFKVFIASLNLDFPLDPAIPVTFTRPIYPYPLYGRFKGVGDPTNASSFEPIAP